MSFFNKLLNYLGFGKKEEVVTTETKPKAPKKQATKKKAPAEKKSTAKKTEKKSVEKKAPAKKAEKKSTETKSDTVVEDAFVVEAKEFRKGLDKTKQRYFGRLISAYSKATTDAEKAEAKEKVETYISKNK